MDNAAPKAGDKSHADQDAVCYFLTVAHFQVEEKETFVAARIIPLPLLPPINREKTIRCWTDKETTRPVDGVAAVASLRPRYHRGRWPW